MKKSLLVLLAAPLLLASCGESNAANNVNFHNDLHYTEKLDDDEIEKLNKAIDEKFDLLSEIHIEFEESESFELVNETDTGTTDVSFYSNSVSIVYNSKSHSYAYGVTEDIVSPTYTDEYWMIETPGDDFNSPSYSLFSYKKKAPKSGTLYKYSDLEISIPHTYGGANFTREIGKTAQIRGFVYGLLGINAYTYEYYKVGDNKYEIVYSTQTKSVIEVQGGDGYREFIQESDTQMIIEVENYKVTSFTSYYSGRSNRDSMTGTWYDNMTENDVSKSTATFKYSDTLSARPMKELSGVLSAYGENNKTNHVMTLASLTIKTAPYSGASSTVESDFISIKSLFPSTSAEDQVMYQDIHHASFKTGIGLSTDGVSCVLEKATLSVFVLAPSGESVSVSALTKEVTIVNYSGSVERLYCQNNPANTAFYHYTGGSTLFNYEFTYNLKLDSDSLGDTVTVYSIAIGTH